jgi:hypothetical protein
MDPYVKIFRSILLSSIQSESYPTRLVWQTILALKDENGIVEASIPGLANEARVTLVECEEALRVLTSPDPYSRTPDEDGRRMLAIEGGWKVVNHRKYRERENIEERKQRDRVYQQEKRDREKINRESSAVVGSRRQSSEIIGKIAHSDTDSDSDSDTNPKNILGSDHNNIYEKALPSRMEPGTKQGELDDLPLAAKLIGTRWPSLSRRIVENVYMKVKTFADHNKIKPQDLIDIIETAALKWDHDKNPNGINAWIIGAAERWIANGRK